MFFGYSFLFFPWNPRSLYDLTTSSKPGNCDDDSFASEFVHILLQSFPDMLLFQCDPIKCGKNHEQNNARGLKTSSTS